MTPRFARGVLKFSTKAPALLLELRPALVLIPGEAALRDLDVE
ncbi:MAG: hypothetical protein U0514_01700 [Candidatus Andersenbacteria bacterium]